jgi:transcriptional regulator with XRE-family HTH domain
MTQAAAAADIGVHSVTYAKWETGKMAPTLARVRKAAEVLGVHFPWLADGTGPKRLRRAAEVEPDASLPAAS